ncbi:MAG: hypothetical protein MZV65_17715 [Chromatiales bacterium]|nr:hypothetical protein [Chromatiales bacterium]
MFEHRARPHRDAAAPTAQLRRALRTRREEAARRLIAGGDEAATVRALLDQAIDDTRRRRPCREAGDRAKLEDEFALLPRDARRLPVRAHQALLHRQGKAAPRAAAGCSRSPSIPTPARAACECVEVCEDDALETVTADAGRRSERLRRDWDVWLDLPTTAAGVHPHRRSRRDASARCETLLLDKRNYQLDDLRRRRLPRLRREDRRSTCSPRP